MRGLKSALRCLAVMGVLLNTVVWVGAVSFRVFCNGHDFADLHMICGGLPGQQYYLKLYRDDQLLLTTPGSDEGTIIYYTDTGLTRNRVYNYTMQFWYYDFGWRHLDYERTVDTTSWNGWLYNGTNNPFPRPTQTWNSDMRVGSLTVVDGVLEINPGVTVEIDSSLSAQPDVLNYPPAHFGELKADGVTFRRTTTSEWAGVFIYCQSLPTVQPIRNCSFDGVHLYVYADMNVFVTDCVFSNGADVEFVCVDALFYGNTGIRTLTVRQRMTPEYTYMERNSLFRENTAEHCRLFDDNINQADFEGNSFTRISVKGSNNTFVGNTAGYIEIAGGSNLFVSNYVNNFTMPYTNMAVNMPAAAPGGNVLRDNTFFGAVLVGSDGNTLRGNYFYSYDYTLSVPGSGNLVYNNYFSKWGAAADASDSGVANRWFITKTAGRNIVGGPYLGGNYWASYTGVDADGDGIGDTPQPVPGSAGNSDALPLVGQGELYLYESSANPDGQPIAPRGQPFAVAQIRIAAGPATTRITSMSFTFNGNTNRLAAIEAAGLFAGDAAGFDNLRILGQAVFVSNRVTFAVSESFTPGAERFFTLAYRFRYEDEYVAARQTASAGGTGTIRLGAMIMPDDIVAESGTPVGAGVTGWVTPRDKLYIRGYDGGIPAMSGVAVETTAEALFSWSLYQQVCVEQNPAILFTTSSPQSLWYLWIKDLSKVHAVSRYANRPYFRVATCAGVQRDGQATPVCEVLDVYTDNGRAYWVRGLSYANPYAYAGLMFDGEIALHVSASNGNYKGFIRDVLTPLRDVFYGDGNVLIDYFKQNAEGGYYGRARILTTRSTYHVSSALAGEPRVLDRRGRSLAVAYDDSTAEPVVLSERIFNLRSAGLAGVYADYDGDGLIDPAVYDETSGTWRILLSGSDYEMVTVVDWGGTGFTAIPADYDGDGKADPAVYSSELGMLYVWLSGRGYEEYNLTGFGGPGCVAVPADYDGDGKADPAVYDSLSGTWRARLSGNLYTEVAAPGWGGTGYLPVPADYDGDGKADPAVYDELTGTWHIWSSDNQYREIIARGMGGAGYPPVPADYDGDGKADPAVIDPVSGTRRVWMSTQDYAPMDI